MKQSDRISKKIFEKIVRFLPIVFILFMVLLAPLTLAGQSVSQTDIVGLMNPFSVNGGEMFQAVYRGVKIDALPVQRDDVADPVFQQWSTMDEIFAGLTELTQISQLNPSRYSLFTSMIGNNTRQKFIQIVFSERSNNTDLWWGNLDKTVEAATILHEIGTMNDTLAQLDELLNYTLQLADYYSTIAPQIITVDNVTVPGWTALTLQALMTYRVTSFLSSKTISFDETSSNYYATLDQAISLGLVTMKDVGLVPLTSAVLAGKNKKPTEIVNGVDLNQTYTYQSSNYTEAETGTTGQLTCFQVPTLATLYPTLLQQSDYYDQLLASYHGSAEITIQTNPTTNPIQDKLITYQNYEMGLIYFSDRQLVTYNVTTPNDYWSYNGNGSLIYVTNATTVTQSYYKPVAGVWVDNYTFVPSEPVTRGLWVWNTSSGMPQPDAYRIQVTLPGNITNEQTFTTERVQGDTITYQALLPIQTSRVYNANVSIEQLSEVAKQQNGTQTDQNILAGLWNKTAVYNNETYYFANGINMTLEQKGEPTGGVVVNQTTLEKMAQVPTYNFTTSYVPITTQYTLTVTIPDMVVIKYNPLDYPGEMLVARDTNTNQSYGVNTFTGQNMGLTEQVGQLKKYMYSYSTGLVSNPNDYLDSNYIFLFKENGTDGFQSNVLSDVISQNDVSTNKSVNLRLSSYISVNNPEPTIYQEYSPLVNYNYVNDTFTQILDTVNQFDTFFTKTVKTAVLQNISNDLFSWIWQWYNSSSGYFRNDVKETASVLELYTLLMRNNVNLTAQNKFYFYDVITALNTTINQYTYSDIENTTTETNVVVTRLSYAADSSEPTAFGRELNVLNILKDLYAIYTPMQSSIVKDLETTFGLTNDTQTIKNYIQQNYSQMHPMGKALLQSVAIINYNQTVNITSMAMQNEISSLAQQNAQRQILLENLQNDPA